MIVKRLIWVILGMFTLTVPCVAWWNWPTRLPHPRDCNRDQLLRWMALRDLSQEPPAIQSSLVDRFQQLIQSDELGESVDVDSRYQQQVDQNRKLLQDLWFYETVRAYSAIPDHQRASFLDRQITTIDRWRLMIRDPAGTDATSLIGAQIDDWLAETEPAETGQVHRALSAAFLRWLSTYDLNNLTPSSREQIALKLNERLQSHESARSIADWSNELPHIVPADAHLLNANGELLLEAWFHAQARRYHALPIASQLTFVEQQVNAVRQSPLLPLLSNSNLNGNAATINPITAVVKMMRTIDAWIQRAAETDREMLNEFKKAIQQQIIRSSLPWMKLNRCVKLDIRLVVRRRSRALANLS